MASYPRHIPAGGEGKISIKVDTSGRGGTVLTKQITVETNDPGTPNHVLTMTGKVEAFAKIHPMYARLFGPANQTLTAKITITPDKKFPFKIVKTLAQHGTNIKYELTETEDSGVKSYVLTIENTKKEKGRYSDIIILTTDSEKKKELRVAVYANIMDAVKGS